MVDLQLEIPDSFYEEEIRSGYTVTRERKELWAVELDLLNEFDRVCREYGLNYFADSGTTLGAVRHSGFIPWDDDIDLVMFRADYNRLCDIAADAFHEPYFFQTEQTDRGSMRGHAQLRNSNTTGMLMTERDLKLPFNQGIFIDIFPLDNVPEDESTRKSFFKRVLKKRKLAVIFARISSRYRKCPASLKEFVIRICHAVFGRSKNLFYDSFEGYMQKYSEPSGKVAPICLPVIPESFVWERSWYRDSLPMPFEFLVVPLCIGYEEYLERLYGDWRVPVRGSSSHGDLFFDTERPYLDYLAP